MRLPETGSGEGSVRDGCLSHATPCWSAVAEECPALLYREE